MTTREQAAEVIARWTTYLAATAHQAFPEDRFPRLDEADWADLERAHAALGISSDRVYADIAREILAKFVEVGDRYDTGAI